MKIVPHCLFVALAALTFGCEKAQSPGTPNVMSETTWDDATRGQLRETFRNLVLGKVRLANSQQDDIIQFCREWIEDDCPEEEWETFVRFATNECETATIRHLKEQATWPRETDCDRLDRVEVTLRDRGILLWQVSPCCDTCTFGELPDRIDAIDRRHPGFRNKVRGYAFFIDQNMPDMLAEDTRISVYLGYGWLSPDGESVAPEAYEKNALDIASEVADCLREHGFQLDWDGSFSKKIGVSLNWQRRTMLE